MIIPVNEAPVHLLQPPSLPLLLNAGVNVLVMMGFSGATVNIQRGASAGVWDLPLYQTLAGRAIESASTVETVTTPMDALVAELEELRELPEGWDGEGAAAPISDAIDDAMSFVRSVGDRASRLAPTPDVDGSILLEIDDGGAGSFRFRGDGTIIHAIRGVAPGIVRFDSRTVPQELSEALEAAL
jgi:hypothetical protein